MSLNRLRGALWIAVALALAGSGLLALQGREAAVPASAAFRPDFALADAAGRIRTAEEFRGRYLLVFFGFTNCPDICPTTLGEVAQVMDGLGAEAAQVQPIFISIDPERDRRLGLAAYASAFHPAILPLAGDAAATRAAAASFRIHYAREDDPAAQDGYAMSHSTSLYLIGPEGDWLRQFEYGTPASRILSDLEERL